MVHTFPLYPLAAIAVCLLLEAGGRGGQWTMGVRLLCLGLVVTWDWNAAFILHSHGGAFPGEYIMKLDLLGS